MFSSKEIKLSRWKVAVLMGLLLLRWAYGCFVAYGLMSSHPDRGMAVWGVAQVSRHATSICRGVMILRQMSRHLMSIIKCFWKVWKSNNCVCGCLYIWWVCQCMSGCMIGIKTCWQVSCYMITFRWISGHMQVPNDLNDVHLHI